MIWVVFLCNFGGFWESAEFGGFWPVCIIIKTGVYLCLTGVYSCNFVKIHVFGWIVSGEVCFISTYRVGMVGI